LLRLAWLGHTASPIRHIVEPRLQTRPEPIPTQPAPPSRLWWPYVAIYVVVTAISTASGMTYRLSLLEWLFYGLALLGILPLTGYVRQRRHDPHWLWRLCLYMGALSLLLAASNVHEAIDAGTSEAAAVQAVRLVLTLPYLFALYRYLFRSPHLWQ
jgi:drug/metabolite transporter (DMT)-like permease